jgi:D-xylose transport system permease protein
VAAPVPESVVEEALRTRGLGAALRLLPGEIWNRISRGELGALPVIIGLAAIWTYFYVQDPTFLDPRNLSNLILQIAVVGTIAIGMVLVLLLGEIDLSVGSTAGLTSAILGVLLVHQGWPWWAAVGVMLLSGAAIGLFQGSWIALIGVPSFVVTLAGLLAWLGVQLHVLGRTGTVNVFEGNIAAIATTFIPVYAGWILALVLSVVFALSQLSEQARRRRAGLPAMPLVEVGLRTLGVAGIAFGVVAVLNSHNGVPTPGVILLGLVLLFSWITRRTKFGRYIYAVGGNAEAARRAGINVALIRISVFTLGSSLAAVGALIAVSRTAAASTQTGGGTLLLEVIAAAVIGGTSLFGGRGTVWAALLGALVIGSVSNGLDLIGQPADVKFIVQGAILLLAITIDSLSRRRLAAAGR